MSVSKRIVFALLAMMLCALASGPALVAQTPAQTEQQDEFVPIDQLPPQDQLPAAPLLISAYAFVWVAVFAYIFSLGKRLTSVQREVERLESDIKRRPRG